jgi:hypothetical protein
MVSCFGMGIAFGAVPSAVAAPQPSKVGTVSYDQAHQALAIPVAGKEPRVQVRRLAPHQYIADLDNCVLAKSEVQGARMQGALLAGWSMDETPTGQTVRLRLTLNRDVDPQLRFVRQGNVMMMTFGGHQMATAALPIKQPRPVLPPVTTKSRVAFPTAAPVPVRLASGQLRPDVPLHVNLATTPHPHHPAAPKPQAKTLVAAHHPQVHAPKPAPKPSFPLMLANRSLPFAVQAPLVATTLPTAPKVPVHLSLPGVVAPVAHGSQVATLGTARYDAKRGVLVVPITGDVDPKRLEVVQLNKRWAFLDVPASHPTFGGVRYEERTDHLFQRWVMAKRPDRNTTRLSFALGGAASFDVRVEGKEILVAVRPQGDLIAAKPANTSKPFVGVKPDESLKPLVAAKPVEAPKPAVAAKPVEAAKPVVAEKPVAPVAPAAKPVAKPAEVLAQAPVKPATTLDRPFFDQDRHGLVVPYTGEIPLYRWSNQEDEAVALEVKGTATGGNLEQSFKQHPVMKTWRVGPDAKAGTVQVAMSFRRPSEVVVAVDTARHQLLLIPQPRLAGDAAPVAAAPATTLSAVKLPLDGQRLYIPFTGKVPTYSIETVNSRFAYINFDAAKLEAKAVQFFAPDFHPTLNYWLMSERPLEGAVRLALSLAQDGGPAVYEDRSNQRLVIELGNDDTMVGYRTKRQLPSAWPGEHAPTGYQPADPLVKVSRKAS